MTLLALAVAALVSSRGDDVVARVDQVTISRSAIERRIAGAARNSWQLDRRAALDSLIADALLAAEARRIGLAASPQVAAFVQQETRRIAALAVVEALAAEAKPTEASLREAFHETADFVRFESLVFASEQDAAAALQRIAKGSTFAGEAAKAVTSQLYASPAKAPPVLRATLLPKVASVLFAAAPGAIAGPVEAEVGWMLARVSGKEIGSEADFVSRRPALMKALRDRTIETTRTHLVQQLRVKMGIRLDEAFLNGLRGAEPSKTDLEHVIATVDGMSVRYADIYPRIRAIGGQTGHMASGAVKIQMAWALVDRLVLEAFAVQRGVDKGPEIVAQRPELERNALAALAAEKIRAAAPAPSDREIQDHYRKNAARYGRPFTEVLPRVAADAAEEKRSAFLTARIAELRSKASVSIEKAALAADAR